MMKQLPIVVLSHYLISSLHMRFHYFAWLHSQRAVTPKCQNITASLLLQNSVIIIGLLHTASWRGILPQINTKLVRVLQFCTWKYIEALVEHRTTEMALRSRYIRLEIEVVKLLKMEIEFLKHPEDKFWIFLLYKIGVKTREKSKIDLK